MRIQHKGWLGFAATLPVGSGIIGCDLWVVMKIAPKALMPPNIIMCFSL
jgi:hypothetical protein